MESISGADPERLEEVVKRLLSESGSSLGSDSCVRGQVCICHEYYFSLCVLGLFIILCLNYFLEDDF